MKTMKSVQHFPQELRISFNVHEPFGQGRNGCEERKEKGEIVVQIEKGQEGR